MARGAYLENARPVGQQPIFRKILATASLQPPTGWSPQPGTLSRYSIILDGHRKTGGPAGQKFDVHIHRPDERERAGKDTRKPC